MFFHWDSHAWSNKLWQPIILSIRKPSCPFCLPKHLQAEVIDMPTLNNFARWRKLQRLNTSQKIRSFFPFFAIRVSNMPALRINRLNVSQRFSTYHPWSSASSQLKRHLLCKSPMTPIGGHGGPSLQPWAGLENGRDSIDCLGTIWSQFPAARPPSGGHRIQSNPVEFCSKFVLNLKEIIIGFRKTFRVTSATQVSASAKTCF